MKLLIVPEGCAGLPALRDWMGRQERRGSVRFDTAASYSQAALYLLSRRYDAALCDLGPDEAAGLRLVREVRAGAGSTPFILITERRSVETLAQQIQTLSRVSYLVREELSTQRLVEALREALGAAPVRRQETQPQRIVDLAPAMIWKTDAEGGMTNFSRRWCLFTGRSEEKERGRGWLDGVHAADLDVWTRLYSAAIAERQEFKIDIRMRSADGKFRWVRHHGIPRLAADGSFSGYLGSSFDITDLKQAGQQALTRVEQFSHANRELESFVHTACHDLHEPLRTLENQLGALATDKEPIDERLRDALANVNRMQAVLRDLLECARVSTGVEPLEPIDMATPLEWALANLRQLTDETEAQVTHEPLPVVDVDATQIARVFQNLIGNAIRSRREDPVAVHVGVDQREDEWCFWVRDNGIGIAPEHQGTIFELFTRLPGSGPAGRGVGLTICKKIVERHGGRIWVESEPDRGSTFFFSLPKRN